MFRLRFLLPVCFLIFAFAGFLLLFIDKNSTKYVSNNLTTSLGNFNNATPTPSEISLQAPPARKVLENNYHIFQKFNNCGPASLSMTLSYYGVNKTQEEIGNDLRPYQVPGGDNDDKSVTLEELAEKSKEYGFIPYHRPMGNMEMVKLFITYDMPVIARTWTKPNEDIGHYRVIKGYDSQTQEIIQDDSLQGKNLRYSYEDFNVLWEKFSYEFLVMVPNDKDEIAKKILGENADEKTAWENAVKFSEEKLSENPDDIYSRFNLSVSLVNTGDFKRATEEFEKVENLLPFRTLWYQIEPIEAYYELENHDKVFTITDRILNNHNRAFSELYVLRGKSYQKLGDAQKARIEFQSAVFYNKNSKEAVSSLAALQ